MRLEIVADARRLTVRPDESTMEPAPCVAQPTPEAEAGR